MSAPPIDKTDWTIHEICEHCGTEWRGFQAKHGPYREVVTVGTMPCLVCGFYWGLVRKHQTFHADYGSMHTVSSSLPLSVDDGDIEAGLAGLAREPWQ